MSGKIVVISGTTASGKSDIAVKLATQFKGYVINADSRQIYKELKVGTAQPTPDRVLDDGAWEIEGVAHYLLGFKSIEDEYNIYKYQKDVQKVLDGNGGQPFLVGGTGLYIDSVIYNYDMESKTRGETRDHLYLYIDVEKDKLDEKIRERIEKMFDAGLLAENERLWKLYPGYNLKPLKSIGYAEFIDYFNKKATIEEVKERIFLHSRQYAKRQRTWFKRNKEIIMVKDLAQAEKVLLELL